VVWWSAGVVRDIAYGPVERGRAETFAREVDQGRADAKSFMDDASRRSARKFASKILWRERGKWTGARVEEVGLGAGKFIRVGMSVDAVVKEHGAPELNVDEKAEGATATMDGLGCPRGEAQRSLMMWSFVPMETVIVVVAAKGRVTALFRVPHTEAERLYAK
jgi:hypothetical protein